MTITLDPNQEQAVCAAILAGQVASVQELIDRALAALPVKSTEAMPPLAGRTVFEQGLGMFGGPEDAALIDEVVALAYAERHRPSQRTPAL